MGTEGGKGSCAGLQGTESSEKTVPHPSPLHLLFSTCMSLSEALQTALTLHTKYKGITPLGRMDVLYPPLQKGVLEFLKSPGRCHFGQPSYGDDLCLWLGSELTAGSCSKTFCCPCCSPVPPKTSSHCPCFVSICFHWAQVE